MNKLSNHDNFNCRVITDSGEEFLIYGHWLYNNQIDSWQGWSCQAGAKRLYIDKNLAVYGGMCKNDYLGKIDDFVLLELTTCRQNRCGGCTDDLVVEKHAPVSNTNKIIQSYHTQVGNTSTDFLDNKIYQYPAEGKVTWEHENDNNVMDSRTVDDKSIIKK